MRGNLIAAAALAAAILAPEGQASEITHWENGFESTDNWWFSGNANIDVNRGLSHTGLNNGWVRNWRGWNAVNILIPTTPRAKCWVQAWLRTSSTLTDGYMSVRSTSGSDRILGEIKLVGATAGAPAHKGYELRSFTFHADSNHALFYVGLWGNGRDAWIQVDDVLVHCPVNF